MSAPKQPPVVLPPQPDGWQPKDNRSTRPPDLPSTATLPKPGARGYRRGKGTIRKHHIDALIERGATLRLNVSLDAGELRYVGSIMDEYDLDDPHAAIKIALMTLATTGSRFSAVQKVKMRQITLETMMWATAKMKAALSGMLDELDQSSIEPEEELRRLREELEST
jgi:hypothetical protein